MSTAELTPDDFAAAMAEHIDEQAFDQVREMDDDEDSREFSQSIIVGFFDQAEQCLEKMNEALEKKDLKELSQLGHFLKGSSATIGYKNIQNNCQVIQQYGKQETLEGTKSVDEAECLKQIRVAVQDAKNNVEKVRALMKHIYRFDF